MSLKKLCPICNKIIDIGQRYCDEHQKQYEARQKERHKEYKSKRNDIKEQRFYKSKEWLQLKDHLKVKYKGMCLYTYLVDHRIVSANEYHHIIEVKDDWNKRLDIYNVIPLSYSVHRKITELYRTNKKEEVQKMLKELLFEWKEIKV